MGERGDIIYISYVITCTANKAVRFTQIPLGYEPTQAQRVEERPILTGIWG